MLGYFRKIESRKAYIYHPWPLKSLKKHINPPYYFDHPEGVDWKVFARGGVDDFSVSNMSILAVN